MLFHFDISYAIHLWSNPDPVNVAFAVMQLKTELAPVRRGCQSPERRIVSDFQYSRGCRLGNPSTGALPCRIQNSRSCTQRPSGGVMVLEVIVKRKRHIGIQSLRRRHKLPNQRYGGSCKAGGVTASLPRRRHSSDLARYSTYSTRVDQRQTKKHSGNICTIITNLCF